MEWIYYSAVMFVGSIVYYLIVKKVQNLGVDKNLYMVGNNIVPVILFLYLGLHGGSGIWLSWQGALIVLINAALFNYVGSIAGFLGIKEAPNSGYSVIIQKSYALYTTFASVILFGSELLPFKLIGVFLILIFTGLIVVEKSQSKFQIGKWFWYSLLAFFLFGGTTLSAKYAVLLGEDANIYLFWVMVVTLLISFFELISNRSKVEIKLNSAVIIWLLVMSVAVSVFYWGKNMSTITAPNVGYTGAINASSNAVLTIVSAIIYKQEIKLLKVVGVLGVVVGLAILVW